MPQNIITYRTGGHELLKAIRPLWEITSCNKGKTATASNAFAPNKDIADLKALLMARPASALLRVTIALDEGNGELAGFCICSAVPGDAGEIDSLHVFPEYKGQAIADGLMRDATEWLDTIEVVRRTVQIGADMERDYSFYAHYGFVPRNVVSFEQSFAQ